MIYALVITISLLIASMFIGAELVRDFDREHAVGTDSPRAPVLDPAPVEVIRLDAPRAVEHVGATEETTPEDYAVPAEEATLDPDPDSPEAWLARWQDEYDAPVRDDGDPLDRIPDDKLIRATDDVMRHVQKLCGDIAQRLTSLGEAGVFDWRINTRTGEMPIVEGPAADRLAAALLES